MIKLLNIIFQLLYRIKILKKILKVKTVRIFLKIYNKILKILLILNKFLKKILNKFLKKILNKFLKKILNKFLKKIFNNNNKMIYKIKLL